MTIKLPRATIDELESLVQQLTKIDVTSRDQAMTKLVDYERSGMVPLQVLLELADDENPNMSMYAISALGRNGHPDAVDKLLKLLEARRENNILLVETIIDALGETGDTVASKALLELIGIKSGWKGKLFGKKGNKDPEEEAAEKRFRERVTLPVVRALENIQDPKAAEQLGDLLEHSDHLVRWHVIQTLEKCEVTQFNEKLKALAANDPHDLVREATELALNKLNPLPPNLNN